MMKKGPRAEVLNEEYYAKRNEPTFHQLGKQYDFSDESGRLYWIAQQNEDTFQNRRLRENPDSGRCVINSYGEVSLFVKLRKGVEWFQDQDGWNDFILTARLTKTQYAVRVASKWKATEKKRSGTVEVKGLNQELCDSLLLLKIRHTK